MNETDRHRQAVPTLETTKNPCTELNAIRLRVSLYRDFTYYNLTRFAPF
jgi:hypothetical protein